MVSEVSVIIPVRDAASTLGAQLEALASAHEPEGGWEVIVADNGSTDESVAVAKSFLDRLPLRIVSVPRPGANAARNDAVAASTGRYLLFCDADDTVDENWLLRLREALAEGHDLVVGRLDYQHLNPPEAVRWRGAPGAGVTVHLGFLPAGHLCNLAVTRAFHERVGGFDESFRGGGDDVDFCWRVQLAGGRFLYRPDAMVNYRLRPSLQAMARQEMDYGAAEVLLYRKFASQGAQRRTMGMFGAECWWLLSRMPYLVDDSRRGGWIRRASRQLGRFQGAISQHTWWW